MQGGEGRRGGRYDGPTCWPNVELDWLLPSAILFLPRFLSTVSSQPSWEANGQGLLVGSSSPRGAQSSERGSASPRCRREVEEDPGFKSVSVRCRSHRSCPSLHPSVALAPRVSPGGRLGQSPLFLAHRWESSQVVTRPAQVCPCGTTPCRGHPRLCMGLSRQKPLHLGKWLSLPPSPAPQIFWFQFQEGGKGEKEGRVGRRWRGWGAGSELGGRQRQRPCRRHKGAVRARPG